MVLYVNYISIKLEEKNIDCKNINKFALFPEIDHKQIGIEYLTIFSIFWNWFPNIITIKRQNREIRVCDTCLVVEKC